MRENFRFRCTNCDHEEHLGWCYDPAHFYPAMARRREIREALRIIGQIDVRPSDAVVEHGNCSDVMIVWDTASGTEAISGGGTHLIRVAGGWALCHGDTTCNVCAYLAGWQLGKRIRADVINAGSIND